MSTIHPLAFVSPKARLGSGVRVGPFCHVEDDVELGDRCELISHVTLLGPARFGRENVFFPHAVLGAAPQDLKYRGGPTRLVVGDCNTFRENVTVHRGTEVDEQSRGETRIGSHNLLMVGVHVAHDSQLADHIIIANYVQIAGHCRIEEAVNVGGVSAMHHFTTIGRNAYVGGMTRVTHDVPPFVKVTGYDQQVRGLNIEGLRRWKFPEESIEALRAAARLLFDRRAEGLPNRTGEALRLIESNGLGADPHVRYLVEFMKRKMMMTVHGRYRETQRSDSDADRERFYGARGPEATT